MAEYKESETATVATSAAPAAILKGVKSLADLSATVVAWNYNEESTKLLPAEVLECLQKHMKSWRQKKYFREYKEWHPNGQVSWYERYDEDGAKEGPCKQWYEDGSPKLLCHYKGGVLDGEWKQWFENGVLWNHRYYKDGELHGEAKSWNEKGELKSHGCYKDGKRDGEYRAWRKNSQLMSHSYFRYVRFMVCGVQCAVCARREWLTHHNYAGTERDTACAGTGGATAGSTF